MLPNFLNNIPISQIDNLNLLYNKYYAGYRYNGEEKRDFLSRFIRIANNINNDSLEAYKNRINTIMEDYKNNGYHIIKFFMNTEWRLAVGLGNESVLETSISLHPLYGFPYIPSTSVKGIARAAALILENKATDESDFKINTDAKIDECAQKVFGTQDSAGSVIFFDAIPDSMNIFEMDIINNHYKDYYNDTINTKPPADWYSPNPINFLSIKPDTTFNFFITSKDCSVNIAEKWLRKGLMDIGAGGKTSSGYGYFY